MKKQRIVKIIVVLALVLVNAVSIAFGIYEYKNGGTVEIASIAKMAAIFGASVLTCIKVLVRTNVKRRPSLYRESYKEYVEKAFITDRKKEKLLFSALDAYNNDDINKALKILDRLLPQAETGADRFAVLSFTAFCYGELNLFEKAIEIYQRALAIKESSTLASNMGRCYHRLGRVQDAINSYKEAIRINPNNANAYNNIGQLALTEGEYEISLQYSVMAAELDTNLKPAKTAMAICFYMLGMNEEYEGMMKSGVLNAADKQKVKNYLAYIGCDDEK